MTRENFAAMERHYNHVSHALLLRTTQALAKFVREHGGGQLPILSEIIARLEADDFAGAAKRFREIHFGKNGFDDWFPPVVFQNEDGDYAWAVFESLVEWWARLMGTAAGTKCA